MPDRNPYHTICTGSNELRATTLNFSPAVMGGTCPAFSSVRKFGSAKNSRSLEVASAGVAAFASGASLLGLSLLGLWPWPGSAAGDCCPAAGVAGGVCCDTVWAPAVAVLAAGGLAGLAVSAWSDGALCPLQNAAANKRAASAIRLCLKFSLSPNLWREHMGPARLFSGL